ncbi:hypothetical protein ACIPR7_18165 [Pectobacterium parvum]|uniref:hypothetical protein n=1 Tax=Pectobacterium TaxID=122277 RepID=UPI0005C6E898|nr:MULTISPECIES: hypothetical protein [Pectobacterium]AZK61355.1 hypothetical protein EIP93_03035 [Pectobacterium versatile]MCU1793489.1 hypothetical protein [Pectobacterium polaris]QQG29331.1 hypothetical protein JFY74_04500 [Pectobacterium carotovorum]
MSESKETRPHPPLKRLRQGTKVLLLVLAFGSGVMFIAFLIASIGVSYPDEFLALRHWMQRTSIGWLVWRLTLYSVLGWGFWKIWHAPGCKPEYRASLKRMGIVSVMFLFACEYAMYLDTGTMR